MMRLSGFLTILGLTAVVAGWPTGRDILWRRQTPGAQNVVYWGQNGGNTVANNDLSYYCRSTSGIDVLVLAFIYQYGGSSNIPYGGFGQSCYVTSNGQGQNCAGLAAAIATCQAAGIKIILSIGGATSTYSLRSRAQAEAIGQYLWDSYGNSGNKVVQRPFGKVFVNGFDLDIESNGGSSQWYRYMVAKLRSNFAKDPKNRYYITGAPQCPIPEPNMGVIISNSQFDYLFVQFYNNNPNCALGVNGGAPMNYKSWASFLSNTPSKNAKIFIGVPAAPTAANGVSSGSIYYATPSQLASIVKTYRTDARFGGIMMWSAGFSDSNVSNGCTYAQHAKRILVSGAPCAPAPAKTTTAKTTAKTTPKTTTIAKKATTTTVKKTTTVPAKKATTTTAKKVTTAAAKKVTTTAAKKTTTAAAKKVATTAKPTTKTTAKTTAPSKVTTKAGLPIAPRATTGIAQWQQCGGLGYTGSTVCAYPYKCVAQGIWWSSCR